MNINKTPLKILSISYYGMDIPIEGGKVYSGTQKRQIDYARFLQKYTILIPTHNKEVEKKGSFYLADNLEVIPVFITGPISFLFQAYKKSKEIIKKQKINALVCDNPHWSAILGVILKQKYHLPLLIHSMAEMINNRYYIRERKLNYIKNIFSKFNFRFTDFLRVSTETEITNFSKQGFNKKKIIHAPFYIDFSKFETADFDQNLRNELLADKFDSIVLFVGRVALQKDLATYMKTIAEATKENPRILFLLIGSGPEFDNIKKLIKELGIEENVSLLGKIDYKEVGKYYKISDIFCATSIYEGTCMTLHEAAICKLPIVATRFAGARDLIQDGENGFLSEIGDYKAIAKNINYLAKNKEKIKEMGEKNYNIIKKNFTREQALIKYKKMFDKLAEKI